MAKDQACRGDSEEPEPRSVREAVFVAIREKNCTGFALRCLRTDPGGLETVMTKRCTGKSCQGMSHLLDELALFFLFRTGIMNYLFYSTLAPRRIPQTVSGETC